MSEIKKLKSKLQALKAENAELKEIIIEKEKAIWIYERKKQATELARQCRSRFELTRFLYNPGATLERVERQEKNLIFRDYTKEREEFVSVAVYVRSKADEDLKKAKNKDFFKEIDAFKEREKCNYAVLVSDLEDGCFGKYNAISASSEHPGVFVCRPEPQALVEVLAYLRNAERGRQNIEQ